MERKGIRTEIGDQNRSIRSWNKQADQMEARLNRMTAWARYQANEERILTERGEEVADATLRFRLANAIFNAPKPTGRKDKRVQDGCGVLNIMLDYKIVDSASFLTAMKEINNKFYSLRSKAAETDQLLDSVSKLMDAVQHRKKHKRLYEQYMKLPPKKQAEFYEQHRPELTQYEHAAQLVAPFEKDGKKLTVKQLKEINQYLEKERFFCEYELRQMKETIHRMECVKHTYITERTQKKIREQAAQFE